MKVFISWSGPTSEQVAKHLHDWLQQVLQYSKPYMSREHIHSGARWFTNISAELETTEFGLICLTRENLTSPWIHFEAGAIAKKVERSRVVPMLFHLRPSDLSGPLTQFQAETFEKDHVFRVLKSINDAAGEAALNETVLQNIFSSMWGRLDSILADIPEAKQDDRQDRSSTVENNSKILEELLVLARQQSISSSDAFKYFADKLQEQSYELNSALNLAFPESAESRRALNDLSRNWDNFLEAWTKFNASSKIAGTGLAITDYETMVLLEAIIELHKPISVLLDQTRTRASREALGATFRHFLRVEPSQAQQAALGGALDLRNAPPRGALDLRNAPPGAADETSPKPGQ